MNSLRRLAFACVVALSFLPSVPAQDAPPPPPDGPGQDPGQEQGQPVSYQVFYDGLVGSGRWVGISGYGSCWQPSGVDSDWAPYLDGHWTYTEEGWTWVSDEPWGWAVYHYGRWILTGQGWFWVPGYTWGPCWVRWRYGNGYCGWAPLPPQNLTIGYGWYNFCRTRDIGAPRVREVILERGGNAAYLGQTSGGFHRNGPAIGEVNDNAFRKVPRLTLHRTAGPVPAPSRQEGDRLHVYAPTIQPPANGAPWHSRPAPVSPGAPSRPDRHDDHGNQGGRGNPGGQGGQGNHGARPQPQSQPQRSAPAPAPAPAPRPAPSGGGNSALNPAWLHH